MQQQIKQIKLELNNINIKTQEEWRVWEKIAGKIVGPYNRLFTVLLRSFRYWDKLDSFKILSYHYLMYNYYYQDFSIKENQNFCVFTLYTVIKLWVQKKTRPFVKLSNNTRRHRVCRQRSIVTSFTTVWIQLNMVRLRKQYYNNVQHKK